jgi:hypothetical protein
LRRILCDSIQFKPTLGYSAAWSISNDQQPTDASERETPWIAEAQIDDADSLPNGAGLRA